MTHPDKSEQEITMEYETTTGPAIIAAARAFDGTEAGAVAAEEILNAVTAPAHVIAASAAWVVRRIAGHANTVGTTEWDHRDDDEADRTLDEAMTGIHHGGRQKDPNLSVDADRAMTALVDLARVRDDEERLSYAEVWVNNPQKSLAIAYVGAQLVRMLADMTGDAGSALDGLACEVMALAAITTTTKEGITE